MGCPPSMGSALQIDPRLGVGVEMRQGMAAIGGLQRQNQLFYFYEVPPLNPDVVGRVLDTQNVVWVH